MTARVQPIPPHLARGFRPVSSPTTPASLTPPPPPRAELTPRPPGRGENGRVAPPPPLGCPRAPRICPLGPEAGGRGRRRRRPGLGSRQPRARGSLLGRRARLPRAPNPTAPRPGPGSAAPAPLPASKFSRFPKSLARAGATTPGAPKRSPRRGLAPFHPSKVRSGEGGRPRLARNVCSSGTQTMIPPRYPPGAPPARPTLPRTPGGRAPAGPAPPTRPHCCPARAMPGARGRSPRARAPSPAASAAAQPAPPTPFQVRWRVSRGESAGAAAPPLPPPPRGAREGGPCGLRAVFVSEFSSSCCHARSHTKEGTFSRLRASPRPASCHPGGPPPARPRGLPGRGGHVWVILGAAARWCR